MASHTANQDLYFLVMFIPVRLLWRVQMQFKNKMALIGLFSASVITMAIAIARAANLSATMWVNGTHDPTYVWLWSAIEPCIGTKYIEKLAAEISLYSLTVSSDRYLVPICFSPTVQVFRTKEQSRAQIQ